MIQQKQIPTKPIILVFAGAYLPGFRAGGPIRSVANLVEALSNDFEFRIIAVNHDFGETAPYPGVVPDVWTMVRNAQVVYLSPQGQSLTRLWRFVRNTSYDVIYLNGFFGRRLSMFPYALWRLGLIKCTPLILAPRGEFSPGALGLRPLRKMIFLKLSTLTNWYNGKPIIWQASSEFEKKDIQRVLGDPPIFIAPPLAGKPSHSDSVPKEVYNCHLTGVCSSSKSPVIKNIKKQMSLSLAFVGRVSRMKNLDFALRCLVGLKGQVVLDLYGPKEDEAYWAECESIIKQLQSNIVVTYHGQIPHNDVLPKLTKHDIMLLPTLGENYGHVICEALSAGCPVIISDQTPWRNLQSLGVGWDLPLDDITAFQDVLQRCVDMDSEEYEAFSSRAQSYGLAHSSDEEVVQMNRQLFKTALNMRS